MNMQKVAPEDFQRQIFQESQELEEQKIREAQELEQRKHKLIKWEGERERARMLQRLESSRAVGQWSGARDNSSFGSCSSSLAFDTDEIMSASSKTAKEADEAMSESSWTALAKEKERDWSIDLEGDMEKREVVGLWSGTEGGSVGKEKMGHKSARTKIVREANEKPKEAEMKVDVEVPQEESFENPKSEKKSDTQEEAEETGFVPSALSEPRGPSLRCDSEKSSRPTLEKPCAAPADPWQASFAHCLQQRAESTAAALTACCV